MTTESIFEMMRGGCFAEELGDQSAARIAAIAQVVEFPAGELIFREGETASSIFIIVDGEIYLGIDSSAGNKRLSTLHSGELLGWSPVLNCDSLTASAGTLTPTRAIQIDLAKLRTLLKDDAKVAYDFMRATASTLAKRLEVTQLQLLDVYSA